MTEGNQPGSARWWAQRMDNYLRSKMPGYERMGTVSEHGVQFRVPLQDGTMMKCDLLMSPWWDNQRQYLQYIDSQVAKCKLIVVHVFNYAGALSIANKDWVWAVT